MLYPRGDRVVYMYWNDELRTYYIGQTTCMMRRHLEHGTRFQGYKHMILQDNLFEYNINNFEAKYINYPPETVSGYNRLNKHIPNYTEPIFKPTLNDCLNSIKCPHARGLYYNRIHPYTIDHSLLRTENPFTEDRTKEERFYNFLGNYHRQLKYYKDNPTIKTTQYICICGLPISLSSCSPRCKEKHDISSHHTEFIEKYKDLLDALLPIQEIPIAPNQIEISEYYTKYPTYKEQLEADGLTEDFLKALNKNGMTKHYFVKYIRNTPKEKAWRIGLGFP